MKIEKNQVVAVKYKLHTIEENGEKTFVEETQDENPLTYLHGVGMMIPKFEEELNDMQTGDKKTFTVNPEDGYGMPDPDAIAELPVDMFKEHGMPQVGDMLPLTDDQGNQFRAIVKSISDESITADLNHPMAGKTLEFEVEIVSNRAATQEELDHGHAHDE